MLLLQQNLQAATPSASVPFGSGGFSLASYLNKKHKKQPSRIRKRKRRDADDEDDLLMLMII